MSIIAKLRTWPESGGPLTHDEAREIIRGTADLHRAIREGQDAWHLLAARNEATIQGARQSERGLCDLKEVNLRIHSLLAAMGYEGSTEKMVDQLVSDAVARKAERDDARAKHAAALEGWEKNQLALARERAEFLAYWQRCKDELAKVQLHMSGRPIYDCIRDLAEESARLSSSLDEHRQNWRTEVAALQSGIVAYRAGRSFMAGGDESALLAWEREHGRLVGDNL